MSFPFTPVAIPFPAGVAAVTLTGTLLAVALSAGQNAPLAVLTINVAVDQTTPADYQPVFTNSAPGDAYPRPLRIPVGAGGIFPIPPQVQSLLGTGVKIQLAVQNAGAATSVSMVTSS